MSWASPNAVFAYFARSESGERPSENHAVRRLKIPRSFRRVAPRIWGAAALAVVAMSVAAIYFTQFDAQWTTFLAGILCAAVFSLASRAMRAEWLISRRTAQLALARENLANEVRLRNLAEDDLACIEKSTVYLHEALPAMLAFIDRDRQVTYHNSAFRLGLGDNVSLIDGRHLREVIGDDVHSLLNDDLAGAFRGKAVHRLHVHESKAGKKLPLLTQLLPQFNEAGDVTGVVMLSTDAPAPEHAAPPLQSNQGLDVPIACIAAFEPVIVAPVVVRGVAAGTPPVVAAEAPPSELDSDVVRLRTALARNEFCLFFQTIEPVVENKEALPFREILLRLRLEEETMMPPGSFLPVAEENNMLPDLDRWVVNQLLAWLRIDAVRQQGVYSVNITAQTIVDAEFPRFIMRALHDFGLPGSLLCFELQESDVLAHPLEAFRFVGEVQSAGCRHALCGFSGDRASLDILRQMRVNFLKIDGGLILNMTRSAVDLARVKAIHRVAHAIGITTIAECVEDDDTIEQLRSIGVHFAQGFGISRPQDLRLISAVSTTDPEVEATTFDADSAMAAE